MSTSWQVETVDGDRLDVLEADGLVVIEFGYEGHRRLNRQQAGDFAYLFMSACWEAGQASAPREPDPDLEPTLDALRRKLAGDG